MSLNTLIEDFGHVILSYVGTDEKRTLRQVCRKFPSKINPYMYIISARRWRELYSTETYPERERIKSVAIVLNTESSVHYTEDIENSLSSESLTDLYDSCEDIEYCFSEGALITCVRFIPKLLSSKEGIFSVFNQKGFLLQCICNQRKLFGDNHLFSQIVNHVKQNVTTVRIEPFGENAGNHVHYGIKCYFGECLSDTNKEEHCLDGLTERVINMLGESFPNVAKVFFMTDSVHIPTFEEWISVPDKTETSTLASILRGFKKLKELHVMSASRSYICREVETESHHLIYHSYRTASDMLNTFLGVSIWLKFHYKEDRDGDIKLYYPERIRIIEHEWSREVDIISEGKRPLYIPPKIGSPRFKQSFGYPESEIPLCKLVTMSSSVTGRLDNSYILPHPFEFGNMLIQSDSTIQAFKPTLHQSITSGCFFGLHDSTKLSIEERFHKVVEWFNVVKGDNVFHQSFFGSLFRSPSSSYRTRNYNKILQDPSTIIPCVDTFFDIPVIAITYILIGTLSEQFIERSIILQMELLDKWLSKKTDPNNKKVVFTKRFMNEVLVDGDGNNIWHYAHIFEHFISRGLIRHLLVKHASLWKTENIVSTQDNVCEWSQSQHCDGTLGEEFEFIQCCCIYACKNCAFEHNNINVKDHIWDHFEHIDLEHVLSQSRRL